MSSLCDREALDSWSRQLFIRDHGFGKAAIQAHQHFGEHTNDWFCKTIKSGKMESNFAIQRLRLVAATATSALHNTPQQCCFNALSAVKDVSKITLGMDSASRTW